MMIEPGWKVYKGMIVGEHTREKRPRDQRAQGQASSTPPNTAGTPQRTKRCGARGSHALEALPISGHELVEVTPKSIRLPRSISTRTSQARRKSKERWRK